MVPIDLIVHTKPMHQAFVRLDSMFAGEVITRGESSFLTIRLCGNNRLLLLQEMRYMRAQLM
jgi:hypothetical protein